ncbi:MAG: peroxiredoxin [Candidatus Azotimanducaceae bacterium]
MHSDLEVEAIAFWDDMTQQAFLDKLAALRVATCDQLPTPQLAVLIRATARLRRSGMVQKALQTGETVPNFHFIDRDNNQQSLYQLLESGPVVLNFFRGFWCMFCKTELQALDLICAELDEKGCHYLAICPQQVDPADDSYARVQFVFDKQNQIARSFNIVYELSADERDLLAGWDIDLNSKSESSGWSLPIPATYIVAQDKTVSFQFADVDFRSRCCPEELIEELNRLKPGGSS